MTLDRKLYRVFSFLSVFLSIHILMGEIKSKAEQASINVPRQTSNLQKPGYDGGNKDL